MVRPPVVLAAALAATLVLASPSAATVRPSDVADDPQVVEQQERLERANSLLEAARSDFLAAIERYEHTRAHAHRLEGELDDSVQAAEQATVKTAQAQERFTAQVRASYAARPELIMTEALLASPDPATALRRADLLRGTTSRSTEALRRAVREADTVTADAALHHDLTGAVAAAAGDQRAAADELEAAAVRAASAVRAAEAGVDAAVADAIERERQRRAEERRREAERRRAEELRRQQAASQRAIEEALPAAVTSVDGKACPVGEPHGFIDSWGFARPGGRQHQGVDIFAPRGTPVYAVTDGTITRVGSNRLGGLVIDLVDAEGHRYYYAHLDAQRVAQGQRVAAGDVIGTVGDTGNARGTPPHLHWEFRPGGGGPVNPYPLAASLCRPTHRGH